MKISVNLHMPARARMGLALAGTITAVALLGLSLMPTTASADDITHSAKLQIVQQADLLSTVTIVVTLHYSCLPPDGTIDLHVSQDVMEGFASDVAICDGQNHTVTLTVSPGPWVPGSAAALALVQNATFTSIGEVSDEIN